MIFVVLGMHKSGTTLLARALHESGIFMGEDFPSGIDYANAKYEARWVQEINDEILGADRQVLSLNVTSQLLPKGQVSDSVIKKMNMGVDTAQSLYGDWGFKDPRTVLTYKYWKDCLPDHRLVIVYRDPLEVWKRYSGFSGWASFRIPFQTWCDYNRILLQCSSEAVPGQTIYLNFDHLLSGEEEWERFSAFVGRDLTDVRESSQSVNRLSTRDRQLFRYKGLVALAGREAIKVFRDMEGVRSRQVNFELV